MNSRTGDAPRSETTEIGLMLDRVYSAMEGCEMSEKYSDRHGIKSAAILTMHNDETAGLTAQYLAPRIEGRVVVEIGGGIGLLALHMAQYAKRVYCIEANPMWSWTFAALLLAAKPKNVSFLFGAADEFAGQIRGDVALFCSHSGLVDMREQAAKFAPTVIDVHRDIINEAPNLLDPLLVKLREIA
jgi:hypothetical protein